jgi:outer membrane scaffolding protein for murein synthesis (MipA/OmpV family)
MRCVAFVAGLAAACLSAFSTAPAQAQSAQYTQYTSPEPVKTWHVILGAGMRYQPDYSGSNDYVFRPHGFVSLSRGTKSDWWSAEDDAISIGFFSGKAWRVGFSGNLLWERKADTNVALVAMGVPNTKFGFEAGAFVEFYPASWLRTRVDLRRGFVAHDGLIAEAKVDVFQRIGSWSMGIGPRMTIAGADYVRTYFGGTTAGNGGILQRFNAGVHSVGALAQATYHWNDKFQTTAYVEYKHLMGDAAKAPIVKVFGSRDSITVGLAASYAFDLGL